MSHPRNPDPTTGRSGRAPPRRESGMAMILIAVIVVILFGLGALAVDGGHIYEVRSQCQATADAAALAAGKVISDQAAARAAAIASAKKNMNPAVHGTVVTDKDVEFGAWDATAHKFTVTNVLKDINAVRVTAQR